MSAIQMATGPEAVSLPPGRHRQVSRGRGTAFLTPRSAVHALAWSSAGLLVMTGGYAAGWLNRPYALTLFYLGLVGITVPCGALLLAPGRSRADLRATSVGLGTMLYLGYFLSSPLIATRFDETLHTGTLVSLLVDHRLLQPNAFLPISPYYPGLELATAAVRWCTGLPLIGCQFVVVLTCRMLLLVLLFRLVERYTRSARAAAFAVALYATSSQFFFFNAQFAYQTMAIVFMLGVIAALQSALDAQSARTVWRCLGAATVQLVGLTITHHLVSWMTAVLLWTWVLFLIAMRRMCDAAVVASATAIGTLLMLGWVIFLGSRLTSYLGPLFTDASSQLGGILTGQERSRAFFTDSGGAVTPAWEKVAIDGSVLLWTALTAFAGWNVWCRRALGASPLRLLPLSIALCYPLLIVARVSPTASNMADRASTFVLMAGALIGGGYLAGKLTGKSRGLWLTALTVLMVGGTILGSGPDWSRVPGPYLAGSEQRSIDAVGLAAVGWAGQHLPDNARVAADLTLDRLIPSLTSLHPVTATGGDSDVAAIYFAGTMDASVRESIRRDRIDYLFVDGRLADARARTHPMLFEGEQQAQTLEPGDLAKFAVAPDLHLIYDGPIRIYDARAISQPGRSNVSSPAADKAAHSANQRTRDLSAPVWWQLGVTVLALLAVTGLRRRRRGRHVARGVVLPSYPEHWPVALIAIGFVGVTCGFRPVIGAALGVFGLLTLVILDRRRGSSAGGAVGDAAHRYRGHRPAPLAVVALLCYLALATAVSVSAAWHALYPSRPTGTSVVG